MADESPVSCGKFLLYPLALHLPQTCKWQAVVVVTRNKDRADTTNPYSKAFPAAPVVFDDEASAKAYSLRKDSGLAMAAFRRAATLE